MRTLPPGPEPNVSDYFDQIPVGLCDTPELVDGVNGASVLCLGVLNVAVVGDGRYLIITYLAPGTEHDARSGRRARSGGRRAVVTARVLAAVPTYDGFHNAALAALVAAGIAAAVWLLVLLVRWLQWVPRLPRAGPETSELGDEPPAVANMLVHSWYVTAAAVPATVVDLAARKVIGLEEVGPGPVRGRVHAASRPHRSHRVRGPRAPLRRVARHGRLRAGRGLEPRDGRRRRRGWRSSPARWSGTPRREGWPDGAGSAGRWPRSAPGSRSCSACSRSP